MFTKDSPIGVFDSGMGGISVLRQLRRQMPNEHFLYYGDCANAPYGIKDMASVRELTLHAAELLFQAGIKALVVACNTATAAAIDTLRERYPDRIIIGIEPALKLACDKFPESTVGVMATPLTLREEKYHHLSHTLEDAHRIVTIPITGLVELVETGKANSPESEALLKPLLEPLRGQIDCLVLGCTHYPFAAETIRTIMGSGTVLLSGGEGTARQTRRRLAEQGLLRQDGEGSVEFRFSGDHERETVLAGTLLRADIPEEL